MKIHSVIVSYNRPDLTEKVVKSYLDTVTLPFSLVIVDNCSDEETVGILSALCAERHFRVQYLERNFYPGYATNRGFEMAPDDATLLHRQDNDFAFLDGWCEQVVSAFSSKNLGQLGLRTDKEEMFAQWNVGGCCVIRRELWDQGLRYDERPWGEYPAGYSEDSFLSPAVVEMGYRWNRVRRACLVSLASGDWDDPYYEQSYSQRGIRRPE